MDRVDRIKGNANQNRNWHRNRNRNTQNHWTELRLSFHAIWFPSEISWITWSVKILPPRAPSLSLPSLFFSFCCSGFGFAVFTNQFAGIFLAYSFRGKIDYAAFPIFQTNWHTRTRCACAYVCVFACARYTHTHTHLHQQDSSMYYTLNILKQIELRKFENLFCFSLWFSSKLYNVAAAIDLP